MNYNIPSPTPPKNIKSSLLNTFDTEIDELLGVLAAHTKFSVDGSGLTVAVLDTGLRVTHRCFTGRVVEPQNLTGENEGDRHNVTDTNGHGTNVAGIIVADTADERRGIAPRARIVPMKVIPAPNFDPILKALSWIVDNCDRLGISVVNMSLGASGVNVIDDNEVRKEMPALSNLLQTLNERRIAVVIAAGNDYKKFETEGMSVPAIFREVISVGAVYDASVGARHYTSGAIAYSTHADQITPFTQRLSDVTSPECYTDVFSAGGAATSAGAADDNATSVQDGTSQAAPTVAGIVLLLQQHYKRLTGELPPISLLQDVLRSTSTWLVDADEDDNVINTGFRFPRVNAFESLVALDRSVKLSAPG